MKTNWQIKKLGEVCDISVGKTPARGNNKFWDEGKETDNVWLSIRDLKNTNKKEVFDSREHISDSGVKLCKKVKQGTLLASFKLTLGRLAFAGTDLYTNEAIAALEIKNDKELNKKYLYYYLAFFDWDAETKGDVKVKGKTLNKAKLKEIKVFISSLPEQKRIVEILDGVFADIAKAKENAEKNLQNTKELFESYLNNIFANQGKDWEEKKLGEVCEEIFAGGDKPKNNFSKFKTDKFQIPIFSNGIKNDGLYGYTNIARVKKSSITISARGTIGFSVIRKEPFLPIIRLVVLSPKDDLINLDFLHYSIKNNSIIGNGTSIPQLTVPAVKKIKVSFPKSIKIQEQIVKKLDKLSAQTKKLEEIYKQKLADLEELKKSVLKKAFARKL